MAYEVHLADSVREKLRKMVKKDSSAYKRLVKLFGQLAEDPYAVGKWKIKDASMEAVDLVL
jgi:mRNA-degrading endonuclease RelE of RelBE toxin-antitoxin system